MTVGERIKYCRERLGITQNELANLSGLHPVSIRKYETNKMQPQPLQLEKIAAALSVSYNALNGISNDGMRLETVGDLMGVIMALCNSGILRFCGERDKDGLIISDTASIQFASVLASYFDIEYLAEEKQQRLSLTDAILKVKSLGYLEKLLQWEQMRYLYYATAFSIGENPDQKTQEQFDKYTEEKEICEIELQCSSVLLDSPDGRRWVKTPPNYHH